MSERTQKTTDITITGHPYYRYKGGAGWVLLGFPENICYTADILHWALPWCPKEGLTVTLSCLSGWMACRTPPQLPAARVGEKEREKERGRERESERESTGACVGFQTATFTHLPYPFRLRGLNGWDRCLLRVWVSYSADEKQAPSLTPCQKPFRFFKKGAYAHTLTLKNVQCSVTRCISAYCHWSRAESGCAVKLERAWWNGLLSL